MRNKISRIHIVNLFFMLNLVLFYPTFSYANLTRDTLIRENKAVDNCKKNLSCLKRLRNNSQALKALFYLYANENNLELAHRYRKLSAQQGNGESQYYLGLYLYKQAKIKQAISWLIQSANGDYLKAQEVLAYMYYKKTQINSHSNRPNNINNQDYNYKQAYYWGYRSAMLGSYKGQELIARMLYYGVGVRANNEKAYMWELIRKKNSRYKGSAILVSLQKSLNQYAIKRVTTQVKAMEKQIAFNRSKMLYYGN